MAAGRQIHIPQAKPLASYLAHREEIDAAIARVLAAGRYILGPETEAFEAEFAAYLGVSSAIGVASGTDALEIALRAVGVVPGDGVVTVSHTAVATVVAIERAGAIPILVDVEPDFMTMDPGKFEAALAATSTPRIRAVVPVHLYGGPADIARIVDIARRNDVKVVEDAAQAHGASLDGRKLGTWGDASAFSFYPTKNLAAFGDGGLVATDDRDVGARVRQIREYGWMTRFVSDIQGQNSRLDELQAAILRVGLRTLDADNGRRREIVQRYRRGLANSDLTLPAERPGSNHVFHQFVVRSQSRDGLRADLASAGVGTAIHYPVPIHQQPAYEGRLLGSETLAESERAAAEILSLPMGPHVSDEDVDEVAAAIERASPGST